MKAVLRFDLDNYDEKEALDNALKGTSMRIAINDLYSEIFRPSLKHGISVTDESLTATEDELKLLEIVWSKVFAHFEEFIE